MKSLQPKSNIKPLCKRSHKTDDSFKTRVSVTGMLV